MQQGHAVFGYRNRNRHIPGVEVSGALEPGNETDAYRFTAQAGERYCSDLIAISGGSYYYDSNCWRLPDP